VPTDTAPPRTDTARFALRVVAWSLGLFGLLRLNWTEAHIVLPLTRMQAPVAAELFGASALPVQVTLACSGADALALCLAAVFAYPVKWRTRLAGAGGGAALILSLNTLRIGTLGRAASSPAWFDALHIYVWPAVLMLAIAAYVFAWMRFSDRPLALDEQAVAAHEPFPAGRPHSPLATRLAPQSTRRFVVLTVAFLLMFSAASPLYLQSASVLALAGFIAHAAAVILAGVGVSAYAAANVLWTPRGGFLVTQECISTPLIPVYLAALCTYSTGRRQLILGVLAAAPIFIALGIARLLVVALPEAVLASPFFLIHAFYQLLLGAVVVLLAALWRHGRRAALGHALIGVIVGVLFVRFLGPYYTRLVTFPAGAPLDDPQGAIAFLPPFQIGLFLALWVAAFATAGWRRLLAGIAVLELTQTAGLLAMNAIAGSSGMTVQVRDVRGWAIAGPLVIVALVANFARPRR